MSEPSRTAPIFAAPEDAITYLRERIADLSIGVKEEAAIRIILNLLNEYATTIIELRAVLEASADHLKSAASMLESK